MSSLERFAGPRAAASGRGLASQRRLVLVVVRVLDVSRGWSVASSAPYRAKHTGYSR
jgi:hypothetical protein